MTIEEQLIRHEGLRLKPYRCTSGKLTIGVGRNIDDRGITQTEALYLLRCDIERIERELSSRLLPWFSDLDRVRQKVLIDMAFNLGVSGLLKFKKTLALVQSGDYEQAATEMLKSRWAKQVKGRAVTLASMMRTGSDPA